jgi:poly(3-hydroxybutyrate) depolymerase
MKLDSVLTKRLVLLCLLVLGLVVPMRAHAQGSGASGSASARFSSVEFEFEHRRYMFSREGPGSIAHVAGGQPGEMLPLVVFLHGMNADRDVHLWMGGGPGNLREHVDSWVRSGDVAPLILAAPTHTRYALAANLMWPDFDLGEFVAATETALAGRAHVDPARIYLVGHSGAGCNPHGGIFSPEVRKHPGRVAAVVAIDSCVDDDVLPGFQALSAHGTRFMYFWQPAWSRPVDDLARICDAPGASCSVNELSGLPGNPHNAILPVALGRALVELLPARSRSPR